MNTKADLLHVGSSACKKSFLTKVLSTFVKATTIAIILFTAAITHWIPHSDRCEAVLLHGQLSHMYWKSGREVLLKNGICTTSINLKCFKLSEEGSWKIVMRISIRFSVNSSTFVSEYLTFTFMSSVQTKSSLHYICSMLVFVFQHTIFRRGAENPSRTEEPFWNETVWKSYIVCTLLQNSI